MAINHY